MDIFEMGDEEVGGVFKPFLEGRCWFWCPAEEVVKARKGQNLAGLWLKTTNRS